MGILLLLLPLTGVLLFSMMSEKSLMDRINIIISFVMLVTGLILSGNVLRMGSVSYSFLGGLFYVDALSVIIIDIVLVISFLVGIYSVGYLEEELKRDKIEKSKVKTYYILMYSFIFTMLLALAAGNMGIMWIAIEATTLASTFLVGFYNDKKAVEASWKYLIICSVGIAVALLGIGFLHLSYVGVRGLEHLQLDWAAMYKNAQALNTSVLKLAFIFTFIGFGTKAGLAPMHTWLPDAHSQAPSPISALLSGVLLNSAVYAVIRVVSILNKNMGTAVFSGRLLIAVGLLSILTAAVFILTQRDYKRLLAYSSIEHMGIIALSIGVFSPASIFAAIYHMINHSFTKSMLFLSAGNVYLKYDTKEISKVNGLLKVLPVSGTSMFLGLFAIAGTPPFSVFSSELNVIISVFHGKLYALGFLLIMLLALIFAGVALALFRIFYPGDRKSDVKAGELNISGTLVILLLLLVISVTGLYIPGSVRQLINDAQNIITGG